MPTIGMGNSI